MPKKTKSLAGVIKAADAKPPLYDLPAWKGPEVDGVSHTLLSRYLCCKVRFHARTIEGWKPAPEFIHRLEYGQMWHTCEEQHQAGNDWRSVLREYATRLGKRYPMQANEIAKWYNVCLVQYPIYTEYWLENDPMLKKEITPVYQEQAFKIKYKLPASGRVVYLNGIWDSVDLINKQIWNQENKTKGDINERDIVGQLKFDLQTMIYIIALRDHFDNVAGVRYNVVRRPLSGGKGSIKCRKGSKNVAAETMPDYYTRLGDIIREEAGYFFMRWQVEISDTDVVKFKKTCLNGLLEEICDWFEWASTEDPFRKGNRTHYRFPNGVYHPTLEGRSTDLDEFIETGSTTGLVRSSRLEKSRAAENNKS